MDLMRAFTQMLAGVTAADASARQVRGVLVWREYVHNAVRLAPEGCEGQVGPSPESVTHRGWRLAAGAILAVLRAQAGAADARAATETAEAARQDEIAAAHDSAAASADDGGAAHLAAARAAREAAATARVRADAAMAWGVAARDAHTTGTRLVAEESAIAFPVGQALAAAGGADEVYGDKRALATDGRSTR